MSTVLYVEEKQKRLRFDAFAEDGKMHRFGTTGEHAYEIS
jgi:hypothetical protein